MKLNKERQAGTVADSSTKVEDASVSQHSSKPHVSGSFLSTDKKRTGTIIGKLLDWANEQYSHVSKKSLLVVLNEANECLNPL